MHIWHSMHGNTNTKYIVCVFSLWQCNILVRAKEEKSHSPKKAFIIKFSSFLQSCNQEIMDLQQRNGPPDTQVFPPF